MERIYEEVQRLQPRCYSKHVSTTLIEPCYLRERQTDQRFSNCVTTPPGSWERVEALQRFYAEHFGETPFNEPDEC